MAIVMSTPTAKGCLLFQGEHFRQNCPKFEPRAMSRIFEHVQLQFSLGDATGVFASDFVPCCYPSMFYMARMFRDKPAWLDIFSPGIAPHMLWQLAAAFNVVVATIVQRLLKRSRP